MTDTMVPEAVSLGAYILRQFPVMEFAWHHDLLIEKLMEVDRGECKRLVISIPPRHGKSLIVTEHFPAWYLGRNPSKQIAVATYGQSLSEDFGKKVKMQVEGEVYGAIFPGCKIRGDACTAKSINTSTRGVYTATSIGGALTGKGAHLLLIDDPVKDRQEAESPTMRDATWNWYTSTARTRVMKGGAIVVVQTRWHEDDLAGRILKNDTEGEWDYVRIPAINEDTGEALWPSMFPIEDLLSIKRDIGNYEFQALYQNDPKPAEGNILPVGKIRYCKELPDRFDRVIQVVDSAIKEKKENDWTVITTVGLLDGNLYEIDQWRGKVAYPKLKKVVRASYKQFNPSLVLIEDKASGQQLIQELSSELPIKAAKAVLDKVQRAGTLADLMEMGRIYLRKDMDHNNTTISEMAGFPNGAHDDIVDTWAYAAMEMIRASILPLFGDLLKPEHITNFESPPPSRWKRFRSMCYSPQGQSTVLWWTVASYSDIYEGSNYPDGTVIIYAEQTWPSGGSPASMASLTRQTESAIEMHGVSPGPAGSNGDIELWPKGRTSGPSPMIDFNAAGCGFLRAFQDEKPGWSQVRTRLFQNGFIVNDTCRVLLEQLRFTAADPKDKEKAEPGQKVSAVSCLRFIANAYKRMPPRDQELIVTPYGSNSRLLHKKLGFE